MTQKIIDRIPETHRHTIEIYSNLIAQRTIRGDGDGATEYSKMLRGYLICMADAGMITVMELRALYLWYRTTRVDAQIREGAVK